MNSTESVSFGTLTRLELITQSIRFHTNRQQKPSDPFLRVVEAGVDEEERDAVIGMDEQWNLLFVVHIETEEERFRIISARRAEPPERRIYES